MNSARKQESTLSSIGSSLTDEALEKEEELKKAKRKYRVLRDALKKEKKENEALIKENNWLRKKFGDGNQTLVDMSEPTISKEEINEMKDRIEKEVYESKHWIYFFNFLERNGKYCQGFER